MKKFAIVIALVMILSLGACSSGSQTSEAVPPKESTVEPEPETSDNTEVSEDVEGSIFYPKDVSDVTIQSIVTYNDYLTMYEMIILDYWADYEAALKDTILYSEEGFDQVKQSHKDAFEKQRETYADMGDKRLIGKESLVEFLINYRDSLEESLNAFVEALG
jgi:hypothetical protein